MVNRLRKKDWIVRPMQIDRGIELCKEHHYSRGASKTSVITFGLFPQNAFFDCEAMGTAIWMPPAPAVAKRYSVTLDKILALSRLAIAPSVPANGASFTIGCSIRWIKKNLPHIRYLVTYADTMEGHDGGIYKATNWTYDGLTAASYRWIDTKGVLMSKMKGSGVNLTVLEMQKIATLKGRWPMHRFYLRL